MPTSFVADIPNEHAARCRDEQARLCGEVAAIVRRAWGRGPIKTTAHWAGSNMLVVVLENGLTDAEKTLRASGHTRQLVAGRRLLDRIIEDELRSSVERNTGRQVETMLSATRLDPNLSAQVFLLASPGSRAPAGGGRPRTTDRANERTTRAAHELAGEAHARAQQREMRTSIEKDTVRAHELADDV
jgi:uncharacterized protein YbcI